MEFVKPGHAIDLRLVADATGADLDDLRLLNPQLLRLVTPDDSSFTLKLPVGTATKFSAAIAAIPSEKWKSWRIHEVSEGETLAGIAKSFKVTPAAVVDVNHLESASAIKVGDRLTIPAAAVTELKLVHYRVRRGDTLDGIAGQFSVTVEDIRKWNGLHGNAAPRARVCEFMPAAGLHRRSPRPSRRLRLRACKACLHWAMHGAMHRAMPRAMEWWRRFTITSRPVRRSIRSRGSMGLRLRLCGIRTRN